MGIKCIALKEDIDPAWLKLNLERLHAMSMFIEQDNEQQYMTGIIQLIHDNILKEIKE